MVYLLIANREHNDSWYSYDTVEGVFTSYTLAEEVVKGTEGFAGIVQVDGGYRYDVMERPDWLDEDDDDAYMWMKKAIYRIEGREVKGA
jgi:hypothetical protein